MIRLGWYGIPGESSEKHSTRTHLIRDGKPLCGYKPSKRHQLQDCGTSALSSVECKSCARCWNLKQEVKA